MFATSALLTAMIPVAIFSYLLTWFLKSLPFPKYDGQPRPRPWLKRNKRRRRFVAFLPVIVGTLLGAIPGLMDFLMLAEAQGKHLPWHVGLILGFFGGLLAYPLHGWIHKGLWLKDTGEDK